MTTPVPRSLLTMLRSYRVIGDRTAPSGDAKGMATFQKTAVQGGLLPEVLGPTVIRDPLPRPSATTLVGSRQNPSGPSPAPSSTSPQSRIDRFLASHPSPEELRDLSHGPRITLESDIDPQSEFARCAIDYLRAHLRAALAIRFDSTVPVLGTATLWDFIRRNIDEIRLFSDQTRSMAVRAGTRTMQWPAQCTRRLLWSDPANGGAGIGGQLPILVHEAKHVESPELRHNADENCLLCSDWGFRSGTCPPKFGHAVRDSSLKYGGAGAAHYYTLLWLADHSGDWLSQSDRDRSRAAAQRMVDIYFCDTRKNPLALPSALS